MHAAGSLFAPTPWAAQDLDMIGCTLGAEDCNRTVYRKFVVSLRDKPLPHVSAQKCQ